MHDSELQLLLDHKEIGDLINRFATALDFHDWLLLRSCFTDEIEVDYFDFRGEPAAILKADDFVELRRKALSELKTQHLMTNRVITIDGDDATCISCTVIYRFQLNDRGDNCFDTHGYYHHSLVRTVQGWKICRIKQTVFWSKGNPQLHGAHRKNEP